MLRMYYRTGWAHIICAIYIPEVFFTDLNTMELISVENVVAERLGRSCIFCERNQRSSLANYGACIQCAWKNCRLHFHVSCAGSEGLLSELPAEKASGSLSVAEILFGATDKNKTFLNVSGDSTVLSKDAHQICEQPPNGHQLNGFCCFQHKKKFSSEASSLISLPTISYTGTDTNKGCKSPTDELCNVNNEPPRRRSHLRPSQRSLTSDSNKTNEVSNSQNDLKSYERIPLEYVDELNHQHSSTIQKDQFSNDTRSLESVTTDCSNPKRIKIDANSIKDKIGKGVGSEQAPPSQSLSSSSSSISNHLALASTITLSQSPVTVSTIPVTTQENLPLILPRRPLSLRGLGISCNSRNSSILNNIAGMYVDSPLAPADKISTSTKSDSSLPPPTLATMHDLLEWQWDQAGALLMQQAKNTDVVTLLDCLHQLKCENDILEAKLIRLTTRHEHLKSVNARLSDSLTTMESTMVLNSPKHENPELNSVGVPNITKISNHFVNPFTATNTTATTLNTVTSQSPHLSTTLHSVDQEFHQNQSSGNNTTKSYLRQSANLFNNYSDPSVVNCLDTASKKFPIPSKDSNTVYFSVNSKRDSTSLVDSHLESFEKTHLTSCLTHTQPILSTSLDFPKSPHESHLYYPNLVHSQLHNDPLSLRNNSQSKPTFDYLSSSCSTLPIKNSTYITKSVDLNDLQELSARLSSAIAARQPQSTKTTNSIVAPYPTLPRNSGQSKKNNKAASSQQSSSSKLPISSLSSSGNNCISKLDTLTSSGFRSSNVDNVQSSTFVDSNRPPYSSDQTSIHSQTFVVFTAPTASNMQCHTILSSSAINHTIITNNAIISDELSTSKPPSAIGTNPVSLSNN
ncbi:Protein AF-10 isoform 3 [Schistosoma japonicum]|uniref:Protein AF-10 isoform 3 n=1 Tax=Schistosoma japonicum TaxID=6182 RepID=A0A4Z2DEF8_SCHJA|nr:Protein AF-10 isoform 3 [Schistosoma japonicum]